MAKYRITQDRWCWCGMPAALIVVDRKGETIEEVCSTLHGQMSIERIDRDALEAAHNTGKDER